MKKTIILLLLISGLYGCEKDEIQPEAKSATYEVTITTSGDYTLKATSKKGFVFLAEKAFFNKDPYSTVIHPDRTESVQIDYKANSETSVKIYVDGVMKYNDIRHAGTTGTYSINYQ